MPNSTSHTGFFLLAIRRLEFYFGSSFCTFICRESFLLFKSEQTADQVAREGAHAGIVSLNFCVKCPARIFDIILNSFQLTLQLHEAFGCPQGWISLNSSQQPAECSGKLVLRLLKTCDVFRRQLIGIDVHLC